jgi:hypothetical protein
LDHAGKISHETAETKARKEYAKYRERTKDELSPVERDFLESVKRVEKRVKGEGWRVEVKNVENPKGKI